MVPTQSLCVGMLLALSLLAGAAHAGPCDLLGGDGDGDGICDDGSNSGVVGDLPCSCPPGAPPACVTGCDDNCPWRVNPEQLDGGRVGDPDLPDGIGDACQCLDVSDDGSGNALDSALYARATAALPPALAAPQKCVGPGAGACDASDVAVLRAALAAAAPAPGGVCLAAGDCTASVDCPAGISCDFAAERCEKNDGQACVQNGECLGNGCCGRVCTDLATSTANCGSCGFGCTNAHGTTSCAAGVCAPVCSALWGDCDGHPEDGCDTSLETLSNCGACGVDCVGIPNAAETCTGGSCGILYCNSGWGDCNGELADGCEISLNTCGVSGCCASSDLGSVSGDAAGCNSSGGGSARGETCFTATFREDDTGCAPTAGMLELSVPADVNYNLYLTVPPGVTCQRWSGGAWFPGCTGVNGSGLTDRVRFANAESCTPPGPGDAVDQTFSVTAEIRYSSGGACGDWQLTPSSGSGC